MFIPVVSIFAQNCCRKFRCCLCLSYGIEFYQYGLIKMKIRLWLSTISQIKRKQKSPFEIIQSFVPSDKFLSSPVLLTFRLYWQEEETHKNTLVFSGKSVFPFKIAWRKYPTSNLKFVFSKQNKMYYSLSICTYKYKAINKTLIESLIINMCVL